MYAVRKFVEPDPERLARWHKHDDKAASPKLTLSFTLTERSRVLFHSPGARHMTSKCVVKGYV